MSNKSNTQIALPFLKIEGPLRQIMRNLGGPDGTHWLCEFNKFLRKEPSWNQSYFAELEVNLGTHKSPDDLLQDVLKVDHPRLAIGRRLREHLTFLSNSISSCSEPKTVTLCSAIVKELGFEGGANLTSINEKLLELGRSICSPEVILQVLLQYHNSWRTWGKYKFAMEPITVSTQGSYTEAIFYIEYAERENSNLDIWVDAVQEMLYLREYDNILYVKEIQKTDI